MGGFLNIGGSSAKTDRKAQLSGFGDLSNLFNFGLDTSKGLLNQGKQTTQQGVSALTSAGDFWKRLLSGNRTTTAQAIAPEANAVQSQADAARRNAAAVGTARTGGTAAGNQTANSDTMAKIDNFLFGVRPMAAQGEADVGSRIASVGGQELATALGFGNLSETSAADLTRDAGDSRKTSFAINRQTQQDVVNSIEQALKFAFA